MANPYIIIKSVEELIIPGVAAETVYYKAWAAPTNSCDRAHTMAGFDYKIRAEKISRTEANELIAAAGLVPTIKNKLGKIYDTPDCTFQRENWQTTFIPERL